MNSISKFCSALAALLLVVFASCEQEKFFYEGPDYVKFADTMQYVAIQNSSDYHDIVIATAQAASHDRTFGIEVVEKQSNAIEGRHYVIESNSVVIKAGERAGALRIRGNFDKMESTDSLGITLRIVNKEMLAQDSEHTHVIFRKVCPFDINIFTGYVRIRSSYFSNLNIEERITKSHAVEGKDNEVVISNFINNGYDLTLRLSTTDPLAPAVSMVEGEVIGNTIDMYGGMLGDNQVRVMETTGTVPMFNTCQKFVAIYPTFYLKDMGVLDTNLFLIEWISDAEAEAGY